MCIRSIDKCSDCALYAICFPASCNGHLSMVGRLDVRRGALARGEALYHAGQRTAAFYSLRTGCVKDVLSRCTGFESVVQITLPGEVAGLGCIATVRAPTTAVAVAATSYCRVTVASVERLAVEVPDIGRELVRLLAASVIAAQDRLAALLERDALARVTGCLLDFSLRMKRRGLDGLHFRLGLSRSDLASYLGVTLETVSRCLTELGKRRLVEVRGKSLRLLRPAELQLILS